MFGSDDLPLPGPSPRPPVGTRDAVPLEQPPPGPARTGRRAGDGRRLVVEWDGARWCPVGVAESYAEACQLLGHSGRSLIFPPARPQEPPRRGG